jgi:peptide/nickel transport system substrate-binding protein
MRKIALLAFAAVILTLVFASFGSAQQKAPVYGGVMRVITNNTPQMMSYVPMMGPGDRTVIFPAAEALVDTTKERQTTSGIEPVLAEKVVEDPKKLTITFHIRKGVKFHDGSELTAEVARWNIQQVVDAKALPYSAYLKGMRVTDKYTLVMDLTEYSNQLVPSWGWWSAMYSKEAWEKASGGDLEKGKEWARSHVVGTGPFMLKDYKRDVSSTWVKNPNYWRKGRPYLDGMEFRYIPDPVTSSTMMMAKEADVWDTADAKNQVDLVKKGFKRQSAWPALGYAIWPNTGNAGSKWKDKRLREAVEYALDKAAIAKALGFGLYKPLKSLPPEGEWGYDPNYNPRPYNPEKAKQLLKEAGYPNGLKAKLLVFFTPDWKDLGTAVKQYLDAVGFDIEIDAADPGRFFGTIYNTPTGPDLDLSLWITGRDTNYLQTYMRWFSTQPFTPLTFLGRTPDQEVMDKQAQKLTNAKDQEAITKKLMRNITDNALVIPIFDPPAAAMQQPWVHSPRYEEGFVRWQTEEVWMEKH